MPFVETNSDSIQHQIDSDLLFSKNLTITAFTFEGIKLIHRIHIEVLFLSCTAHGLIKTILQRKKTYYVKILLSEENMQSHDLTQNNKFIQTFKSSSHDTCTHYYCPFPEYKWYKYINSDIQCIIHTMSHVSIIIFTA